MAIEYKLCAADTATELNKQVNELLQDDWALYGNPFFSPSTGRQPPEPVFRRIDLPGADEIPKKVAGVR